MRKFQIDIRFTYIGKDDQLQKLSVYSDSNNAWETVCAGFYELIDALRREGSITIPGFGRREHYWKVPD